MDHVKQFNEMLQTKVDEYMNAHYPNNGRELVHIRPGKKYVKIDIGSSGKFMFDTDNGHLYFIKGYGVIDRKKDFGYLPAIIQKGFKWDGFSIIAESGYASRYGYAGKIA